MDLFMEVLSLHETNKYSKYSYVYFLFVAIPRILLTIYPGLNLNHVKQLSRKNCSSRSVHEINILSFHRVVILIVTLQLCLVQYRAHALVRLFLTLKMSIIKDFTMEEPTELRKTQYDQYRRQRLFFSIYNLAIQSCR